MFLKLFSIFAAIQVVLSQGITYKDGKVGVEFGGYNAEAGLGGLLTGNAAHGGLSASAGTPTGQRAVAGLGGSVDGNASGGLYAGATGGSGIGASTSLGGTVQNSGVGIGAGHAEAHAGGVSKQVVGVAETLNAVVDEPAPPVPAQTYSSQSSVAGSISGSAQIDNSIGYENETPAKTVTQQVSSVAVPVQEAEVKTQAVLPPRQVIHTQTVVPQQEVVQTQAVVPQQQAVQTQAVVPQQQVVVQKVKTYVRPRPQTYVFRKEFVVPTIYKTVQYKAPVPKPVVVHQYSLPEYRPIVYRKQIQIQQPVQEVRVEQRVQAVETTEVPLTTTVRTTAFPPYVYTYNKQRIYDEIFSIPIVALQAVNSFLNAKANSGYTFQKTISYN